MARSEPHHMVAMTEKALGALGLTSQSKVLVSVSGGIDSMALATVLGRLYQAKAIGKLGIAHINHQLRGAESDADEKFVEAFADRSELPLYAVRVDVPSLARTQKRSLEEAARSARYHALTEIARGNGYDYVVTAHHAGDVVETLLINVVRGAGLRGMSGIPKRRKLSDGVYVVRPWLHLTRAEIEAWVKTNNIEYRTDTSNMTRDFLRNRLRHDVLPALEEAFTGRDIYRGIENSLANVQEADRYFRRVVRKLIGTYERPVPPRFVARRGKAFDAKLLRLPKIIFREFCQTILSRMTGAYISLGNEATQKLEAFRSDRGGTAFELSGVSMYAEGELLVFEQIEEPKEFTFPFEVGKPVQTDIGELWLERASRSSWQAHPNLAVFDVAALPSSTLIVRSWMPGDRMKPFGMKGHSRLISDLLSEAGIKTERLKHRVPLVALRDDPSTVLWVPGIRAAEIGRVGKSTETVLLMQRKPGE